MEGQVTEVSLEGGDLYQLVRAPGIEVIHAPDPSRGIEDDNRKEVIRKIPLPVNNGLPIDILGNSHLLTRDLP
jgi:hypothetical protein